MEGKLTKAQKDYIVKLLQEGRDLPDEFRYLLFPSKQNEYELIYAGKIRKEDLIANEDGVFPVPLQVDKVFNGEEHKQFEDGWRNMIIFGDNLQFLKTVYENKDPLIKDKVKGKVQLIYIDPPFGTGDEYDGNKGQSAYSAKRKGADFVEFLRRRLILLNEILADDGSIFVRLDYHFGHYMKAIIDEIFGKNNFRNEIVINRFKRQLRDLNQFNVATDSIFFYTKGDASFFNEVEIGRLCTFCGMKREPQWRGMSSPGLRNPPERIIFGRELLPPKGRHWSYTQERINQFVEEKRIRINEEINYKDLKGKKIKGLPEYLQTENIPVDSNWTDLKGYVFASSYPTENPEELLQRVLLSASEKGDLVMDVFGGSGTTAAVAEKLGRRWITCDIGKLSYYTMQKRILTIQDSKDLNNPKKKHGKKSKSFIAAQLGLYDLGKVFDLQELKYKEFVMGLFEVEPLKNQKISGFEVDGKKGEYYVKIFQHWKFKGSSVDETYLKSIHSVISKKVSGRFYIIAPANYVDFLTDYHEIEGIRYYFLKIPYQVIKDLHKTPFQKLRQPQSKKNVNDLEETIGFHFIRQPEVKSKVVTKGEKIIIKVDEFRSHYYKGEEGEVLDNFETLAMVLIDTSYNDKEFIMEKVYFADELLTKKPKEAENEDNLRKELKEQKDISIMLDKNEVEKRILVVYVDIYGNEFKEILTIK
jgi:site-specific DNA-methyltransferase (adenine-specific)/adenine-specific DNA-methyltransferase